MNSLKIACMESCQTPTYCIFKKWSNKQHALLYFKSKSRRFFSADRNIDFQSQNIPSTLRPSSSCPTHWHDTCLGLWQIGFVSIFVNVGMKWPSGVLFECTSRLLVQGQQHPGCWGVARRSKTAPPTECYLYVDSNLEFFIQALFRTPKSDSQSWTLSREWIFLRISLYDFLRISTDLVSRSSASRRVLSHNKLKFAKWFFPRISDFWTKLSQFLERSITSLCEVWRLAFHKKYRLNIVFFYRETLSSFVWYETNIVFLESCLLRIYDFKFSSRKIAGFRYRLLSSFDKNRVSHSYFRGLQSGYEAAGNVCDHFWYPSIIFNRNDFEIPMKNIGWKLKEEKKARDTPCNFPPPSIFSSKFCVEFSS